jgi:uncharacterized delta-60 repeat protein
LRPRHARGAFALLAIAALALTCDNALAAAGGLDPAFDADGKRVLPDSGRPAAVLAQRDGKVVVAGTDAAGDFAVWRLKANGALDAGFDDDGFAAVDFGEAEELTAAALQADGKIILAGESHAVKGTTVVLARLNADGAPDKTFDPGGGTMLSGSGGLDTISSVLVQRDGRIVLAGKAGDDFGLLRLYTGGGTDGTVFEPGQFGGDDTPTAAALQPDGKIVVAGTSAEIKAVAAAAPAAVITRYRPDGKQDPDFGKRSLGKGRPAAVLVQRDGKIVAESLSADADSRILVARLGAAGEPDLAFGRGGTAAVDLHGPDVPAGAALQRDGKILVAGSAGYDFSAARLTGGGAPDRSFGTLGGSVFGFTGVNAATASALQADGKLVIAGQTVVGAERRVAVARLLPDPAKTGGPAHPRADTTAPRLTGLRVVRRAIRFRLSEPARVRLRLRHGQRTRVIAVAGHAGANRVRLRRLAAGRYRLTATARDAAGNAARPRRATFRLIHR